MYLDTDGLLALLQPDARLQDAVESATFASPKTSVVTTLELLLVMFDTWSRSDLAAVVDDIRDEGVEVLALTPHALQVGADRLRTYPGLTVFDAVPVGQATTEGEPSFRRPRSIPHSTKSSRSTVAPAEWGRPARPTTRCTTNPPPAIHAETVILPPPALSSWLSMA